MSDITVVLDAMSRGETDAAEKLLPLVYSELRTLAAAKMSHESAGHTLQPTALVHEAWLRVAGHHEQSWQNRAHFFGAAAEAMRRILVDHARRKARPKHGGDQQRLNIEDLELAESAQDEKLLLIDEALDLLEREDPERARVVMLKYFSGLTNKEVAEAIGASESTVERHWVCAKHWLFRKIHALA